MSDQQDSPEDEVIHDMQFSCLGQSHGMTVSSCVDGTMILTVSSDVDTRSYRPTLGQVIHLRDFLNRHIDELALKQTGSLAVRSSDDPTQLAAVEEVTECGVKESTGVARQQGCGAHIFTVKGKSVYCGSSDTAKCVPCGGIFYREEDLL